MLTEQQKQLIQRLWADNFLNFKEGAKEALARDTKIMYIAIELKNTIIDKNGVPFEWALSALEAISKSRKIKWIVWTPYTYNVFDKFLGKYLGNNIKWDFYNENPDLSYIDSDPRRINYDVIIDSKSGFKGEQSWFWIKHIIDCIDRMLPVPKFYNPASPNPFSTDQFKVDTQQIPLKVAKPLSGTTTRFYNAELGIWQDKK